MGIGIALSCLTMPRKRRIILPGGIYHVVNRGNDKRVVFPGRPDYARFIALMQDGRAHAPVRIAGYCLMPTHFHLMLTGDDAGALSTYMHWVTGSYATDLRRRTNTRGFGHIFQRRFWAAPIGDAAGFIAVLRYVEANALRARLVARAEDWEWTSLVDRFRAVPEVIDVETCPVTLPPAWSDWVNLGQEEFLLEMIRRDLKKVL